MGTPLNSLKISLPEKIADDLRHNIILGLIHRDEHLNEVTLSEGYGVSRGSIRQALMMLENEGLVKSLSNGRTKVLGFGVEEMKDYYRIRLFLECEAVKKIVTYPDDETYKQFVDKLSSFLFVAGDIPPHLYGLRCNEMDMNFHFVLVDFAGSQILRQTWSTLASINKTILILKNTYLSGMTAEDIQLTIQSHKKIVELLSSRNLEALIKELEWHIDTSIEIYQNIVLAIEKGQLIGNNN